MTLSVKNQQVTAKFHELAIRSLLSESNDKCDILQHPYSSQLDTPSSKLPPQM